jgi:molybdopterin biosynthesis enzyme
MQSVRARLAHAYRHPGGRAACLPAHFTPGNTLGTSQSESQITILPWLGSADLAALADAQALIRLPSVAVDFEAGSIVEAFLI